MSPKIVRYYFLVVLDSLWFCFSIFIFEKQKLSEAQSHNFFCTFSSLYWSFLILKFKQDFICQIKAEQIKNV